MVKRSLSLYMCYTVQFSVQLVSQRLNLLRCNYMKGGVKLRLHTAFNRSGRFRILVNVI